MKYLYGDSTASSLKSNVLEFLRDVIDFSVYVLEADQRIAAGRARMEGFRQQSDADINELDGFARTVLSVIESTPKHEGPTARCSERMAIACNDASRLEVDTVRARFVAEIAQAEVEESTERDGCVNALMTLLSAHEPPESSVIEQLKLRDGGGYDISLAAECAELEMTWRFELGLGDLREPVPRESRGLAEGHLFAQPVRVDRLAPSLEIQAPELSGWLKKEVKMRARRIDHHTITEVVRRGSNIVLRIRAERDSHTGFDIEVDLDSGRTAASRIAPAEAESAGPFDLVEADRPKVLELSRSVHAALGKLPRRRLTEAKLGDADFRTIDRFAEIVQRLVRQLTPIIHEIATHSLEPSELVLRRQLGDDRREEIYVSRSTLREKYERLSPPHRDLFAPLALHTSLSRSLPPGELPGPATRAELAPSRPPPPREGIASPIFQPPAKAPSFPSSPPPAEVAETATTSDLE